MKFEAHIDCDNAAFVPDAEYEVSRILDRLAMKLREGPSIAEPRTWSLFDVNGNRVGFARLTQDDEVDDREFLQPDHDEELS